MHAQSSPFNIRPATVNDVDRLCEFVQEFAAKTYDKTAGKGTRQVFQHVIEGDTGILLVAEHKGGICAYTYASYQWRSEFGGQTMDMVELFVESTWRHKGVGAQLITALLENAKQHGIRRLSAEVHPGNATIERILENAGFDPEHRTVWGREI